MAQANESLVIDVTVNDTSTVKLEQIGQDVDGFGRKVQTSFERTQAGTKKASDAVEVFYKKLQMLAKASVALFTVDLASKVLGFSSAFDLLSKASEFAAKSIASAFGVDGDASKALKAFEDRLKSARDTANAQYDLFDFGGLQLRSQRGSFTKPENEVRAAQLAYEAQGKLSSLYKDNSYVMQNMQLPMYQEAAQRVYAEKNKILSDLANSIAEMERAERHESDVQRQNTEIAKANNKALEDRIELMRKSSEATNDRFARGAALTRKWAGDDAAGRFGATLAGVGAQIGIAVADRQALAEWNKHLAEGDAITRKWASDESVGKLGLGFANLAVKIGLVVAKANEMSAGEKAFARIVQSIGDFQDAFAAQGTDVAFYSFRGFFNDIITGAAKGAEAFKRFAASIVAGLADILAQQLAMRAVGGLFYGMPFFGSFAGGFANGGVVRGGINSFAGGGIATGPQLAMIGDNRSQTEAVVPMPDGRTIPVSMQGGGAGKTVNMTLNVASLDPSTAASVILAQMPAIQRALTDALSGSDRNLIVAVRGAAS